MKVLVTGGAGYIGSHMVYILVDNDIEVIVLDNISTGNKTLLPENVKLFEMNVGDGQSITELLKKENISTVIHFAADVSVDESVKNPLKYYLNNTSNTTKFFKSCVDAGVKNIIFSSTAAVYGASKEKILSEMVSTKPISAYGSSKLFSEKILIDTCETQKLNYVIFRYFNVAGSDPKRRTGQVMKNATHLIKVACETALGKRRKMQIFGNDYDTKDGTCIRDYIHVWDLVSAHLKALEHLENGGSSKTLNCGYGKGFSVLEVVNEIKKVSGIDFSIEITNRRMGDPAKIIADNSRILKELNWLPKYNNLEKIVIDTLEWEKKLST